MTSCHFAVPICRRYRSAMYPSDTLKMQKLFLPYSLGVRDRGHFSDGLRIHSGNLPEQHDPKLLNSVMIFKTCPYSWEPPETLRHQSLRIFEK